jgi:hypothetical protein
MSAHMSVTERFSLTLIVSGDSAHAHMSAHERERVVFAHIADERERSTAHAHNERERCDRSHERERKS